MLSLKAELSVLWSWFSLNLVRKVKLWSRPGNAQSFEKPAVNPALLLILSLSVLIPKCPMLFLYLLLSLRSGGIGQGPDLFFFFFSFLIWEVQERLRWPSIVSLACEFPGSPHPTSPLPWNFVFFMSIFRQEVDKWYKCLCAAIFT